jgi:para-nitrobenzyl esterase
MADHSGERRMVEAVITLDTGPVVGAARDGVRRFLGVPYAAAPVGPLRFAKPEPHPVWSEARDATDHGPTAPQSVRDFPGLDIVPVVGTGWSRGDDFLTANIWTPEGAAGLPVMVFVHGGGFVLGSNNATVTDGTAFARDGVICVAITYRMGIEGFLAIPGAPTNLGLRDVVAALEWVRRNAAALGGDVRNITVFGESAGAMLLADLVASPASEGLFRRAILQSGHGAMVRTPQAGKRVAEKVAAILGVTPDLDGFRSTTIEQAAEALATILLPTTEVDAKDATGRDASYGLTKFLPVTGDDLLPEAPLTMLAKGGGRGIEILIGTCREEMNLYFVPTGVRGQLNDALAAMILGKVEPKATEVLAAYGLGGAGGHGGDVFVRAMSDLVFRQPARDFSAAHRGSTHVYEMEWRSPASGGELGACHGVELPFVFDTLASCTGPQGLVGEAPPQALADRIHALWVGFARDGFLPWGEYSAGDPQVFALEAGAASAEKPLPCAAIIG